jgi:hemoglobin-like flavoprotein
MSSVAPEPDPALRAAQSATFEASIGRCLASGDFIQAFYERFLSSSPEVARRFEHTDFAKQRTVLKNSLYSMAIFALGVPQAQAHLELIAERHSRRGLDISPSLYTLWLETLVRTAREFDPEFNAQVELAWRGLLGAGIARMVEVYLKQSTTPPGG